MATKEQKEFAKRQVAEVLNRKEFVPSSLEERIQVLEDKDAIRDLIGRYAIYCDAGAYQDLYGIYSEDIERTLTGTLDESVKGKAEVRRVMEDPNLPLRGGGQKMQRDETTEGKHIIAIECIRIAEDRDTAYAAAVYQLAMADEAGGTYTRGLHEGRYIFSFRREPVGWRFTKLEIASNIGTNPELEVRRK
jgi:ketosteroid isomerase-like protein